VTAKEEPGDIDLIVVLAREPGRPADMRPFEYNALTKTAVRRMGYPFDLVIVPESSTELDESILFFHQVRDSNRRKGLVRVWLR